MRQQRLRDELPVACDRGLNGETLVRGDVLDEPEQLRRERRLWERARSGGLDQRRQLDDVVGREPGERPVVPYVHDLDVAAVLRERGDELRRGLAVVGAAAPLEQC